ncbi:MAG: ABC transporter ATP-binding protein [Bacteroidales bacterium]|nr:ABC transporter ATP-binding protein [Bacteroidales bacterium]
MEPLLEVKDLRVIFPGSSVPAVDNLHFELFPKETLGIVGESGSGKSATAHAILRLLPKGTSISGAVYFRDYTLKRSIDLTSLSEKEINQYRGKKISIIFQDPMASLNPSIRCGNQVDEMLELHTPLSSAERKKRILKLFEEMQLPHPEKIYKRYPHELSGGQRQRIMMAIALASNPHILIADEPTTALDVTTQQEILTLLKQLQQKYALSILFISHDLRLIERIADRVVVMQNGKMVETADNPDIFLSPKEMYTQHLLSCRITQHTLKKNTPEKSSFDSSPPTKPKISTNNNPTQASPIIEIRNLEVKLPSTRFVAGKKDKKILKQISLQLWEGETLGIVGESGSGKTTLGRTLMQLIRSYDGEILFEGIPANKLFSLDRKKFYRKIQIIFQDPYSTLNPRITIGELIREPLTVHRLYKTKKEQIDRVKELLESVQIDKNWYDRYPHQLSGGQRQRIAIARALALEPKIIICDECVSALDATIAAQILSLLNELKLKFNLSYIFISHDLSIVRFMSDRVIVLKDGLIVEENNAYTLFENPQHAYTQQLIRASL